MSRPCEPPVAMTKSARARFSASGTWQREDSLELLRGHAGPGEHPRALHLGRRGDDRDLVDLVASRPSRTAAGCRARPAARRHARRGRPRARAPPPGGRSPRAAAAPPARRARARPSAVAVDARRRRSCRETRPRSRRPARRRALQPVDLGVGVEHRHAFVREHRRHGRLAHADRAGEAEDDHDVSNARSSASCSRGAVGSKKSSKGQRRLADQHRQAVDRPQARALAPLRAAASRAEHRPCRRRSVATMASSRARSSRQRRLAGHAERRGVDDSRRSRRAARRRRRSDRRRPRCANVASSSPALAGSRTISELDRARVRRSAAHSGARRAAGADQTRPVAPRAPAPSLERLDDAVDVGVGADEPPDSRGTTVLTAPIAAAVVDRVEQSRATATLVRHGDVAAAPVGIAAPRCEIVGQLVRRPRATARTRPRSRACSSQNLWISGDLRLGDRIADHLGIRHAHQLASSPRSRRIGEQRQQRQAEDGEMAALDPLEQLHARALDPVDADAPADRLIFAVEIVVRGRRR